VNTFLSLKKWPLRLALCLVVTPALAGDPPIAQQNCLYYQGKDPETLRTAAEQSAATKFGLKLGLVVRKKQTVQWVLAYQRGFADAKGYDAAPQTAEQVTQRLDVYCDNYTKASLLQAARALTNGA